MIDSDKENSVRTLSLYLTVKEAEKMIRELKNLLNDPDGNEHFHIFDEKVPEKEISCSLITEKKLKNLDKYNEIERKIFLEDEK